MESYKENGTLVISQVCNCVHVSVTMRCKTRNCPLLIKSVKNKIQNLVKQKVTVQFVVNVRKCIVNLNH